jgi:hypothetical protein
MEAGAEIEFHKIDPWIPTSTGGFRAPGPSFGSGLPQVTAVLVLVEIVEAALVLGVVDVDLTGLQGGASVHGGVAVGGDALPERHPDVNECSSDLSIELFCKKHDCRQNQHSDLNKYLDSTKNKKIFQHA